MTSWVCLGCGAHGEDDRDDCPRCGAGVGRLTVWMCCECWTEGRGDRPDECPACGRGDSWFQTTTDASDPRPAKALFDEMLDSIFSPSRSRH